MHTEPMEPETAVRLEVPVEIFRSPRTQQPLAADASGGFVTADGERFPVIDGVLCLIDERERGRDLGDAKFYEDKPFGIRDWSNPAEVEAGVEREIKELLARTPKDALIADVGCGSGRVSNYMSLHGFERVVSIDYSLTSVKMVRRHSRNTCVWGNNLELPFASNTFDLVISTGVIHHTPDPERALAECARIVKPGGLFFLKVRNLHSPYGYLFHTYGAALRTFERTPGLGWLSDLLGFRVYKLTRRVFYRNLPNRPDAELRGKYENLFIKKLITFFTTPRIKQLLGEHKLEIQYGWKTSATHRQHFYVSKKRD